MPMASQNTNQTIVPIPLSRDAFAPFGEVIQTTGYDSFLINNGNCARYHDLSRPDIDDSGVVGINIFEGQPYSFPI